MNITKDEIDKLLKKAKIGDRGYFNKEKGKEYCVAKKWQNTVGEYKNFVYLVSIEHIKNLKKAVKDELGVMINADWIYKEYDYKNLFQKDELRIDSIRNIKADELWFEDGILIEEGIVNALTTLDAGQVEDIFGLKELKYDTDYYDVYLNYNPKENNCEISIVAVGDDFRNYYKYIPKENEQEFLKKALEEYTKSYEGKPIQELLDEVEELEQE